MSRVICQTFDSGFLAKLAKLAPLTFVLGMRHAVGANVSCKKHAHDTLEIIYHCTGHGVIILNQTQKLFFKDGSVTIIPPNQIHDQVMKSDGEDLCVQIAIPSKLKKAAFYCLQTDRLENSVLVKEIEFLARAHQRRKDVTQVVLNLRATALLLSLIQESLTVKGDPQAFLKETHIERAESYIAEHFHSIGTVAEVAAAVGISYHHLRHIFKQIRGESLIYYLNRVKIDRAKALLTHSRLPLKQVATSSGFKDEFYFSTIFKQFTGTTPSGYRNGKM